MPDSLVADFSWARPPVGDLKAHFAGVARYLGAGAGKLLTKPEMDEYLAAGLAVAVVWETSAHRMDGGFPAGAQDAHEANAQADALGWPADRPIFFANDQNAATQAHVDYMRGAKGTSARPVGVYGNAALIDACWLLGIGYGWHVSTWGPRTGHACLSQEANWPSPVAGTDLNVALRADWGQHPFAAPAQQEDQDMQIWIDTTAPHRAVLVGAYGWTREFTGPVGVYGVRPDMRPYLDGGVRAVGVTAAELAEVPRATAGLSALIAWVARLFPARARKNPPPAL